MHGSEFRLLRCLKDIVKVAIPVVLLGPVGTTLPVTVDDELVHDLLVPWNSHSAGETSVAFDQTNGRRPLESE